MSSIYEQSSLCITPNAVKAGKLYSAIPNNGAGDLDVVRATSATRVNSAGLIETVGNNIARLDYSDGSCPSILVEPQRTNLLLNSQFNNAISGTPGTTPTSYTNIQNTGILTVISNPIGNKLQFTTNGTNARAFQQSVSILANTTYTFSVKAEILTPSIFLQYMNVGFPSGATTQFVYNGTNVASNFSLPIGECDLKIVITNGINAGSLILRLGSGIFGNTNGNIIIREPQLEVGSNATSYIPTTSSAVTRNADVISKTGISSLINSEKGCFYVEANSLMNGGIFRQITLSNGTDNSRLTIGWSSIANTLLIRMDIASVAVVNNNITPFNQTSNNKILVKWGEGNLKTFINGVERLSLTSLTMPTANLFTKLGFDRGVSDSFFVGNVKSVLVFPTELTDQQCIDLTTL